MTNSTAGRLVDDYLTRLADAARALPPDRRTELLSAIREHIDAWMSGNTGADEPAIRTMLDRLGEPDDIVAAAMEIDLPERPTYPQTPDHGQQGLWLEWCAIFCLTAGSLLPVFGWLIGLVLLWSSGLWRRSEKILATLIFPGGPALALVGASALIGLATSSQCLTPHGSPACAAFTQAPVLSVALLLIALTAPVVVAIVLLNRARSRAALGGREPRAGAHVPRPNATALPPKDAT